MRIDRIAAVAVLAVAPPDGAAGVPPPRPPSSVGPQTASARVTITHHHQRVTSCQKASSERCAALLEDAGAGATVRMERLTPPNTTARETDVLEVELANSAGQQERLLELALGQWSISWQGYAVTAQLSVSAESSPLISLETHSGRCALKQKRCIINDQIVLRSLGVSDRR